MIQIECSRAGSPSELAIEFYEGIQGATEGRARRAANFLSTLTCLELDGKELPASPWCTLILIALADLELHAPSVTLTIAGWTDLYQSILRSTGEESAQQVVASLAWAASRRHNVRLEPMDTCPGKRTSRQCLNGNWSRIRALVNPILIGDAEPSVDTTDGMLIGEPPNWPFPAPMQAEARREDRSVGPHRRSRQDEFGSPATARGPEGSSRDWQSRYCHRRRYIPLYRFQLCLPARQRRKQRRRLRQ
jgi:hypothetical protein